MFYSFEANCTPVFTFFFAAIVCGVECVSLWAVLDAALPRRALHVLDAVSVASLARIGKSAAVFVTPATHGWNGIKI